MREQQAYLVRLARILSIILLLHIILHITLLLKKVAVVVVQRLDLLILALILFLVIMDISNSMDRNNNNHSIALILHRTMVQMVVAAALGVILNKCNTMAVAQEVGMPLMECTPRLVTMAIKVVTVMVALVIHLHTSAVDMLLTLFSHTKANHRINPYMEVTTRLAMPMVMLPPLITAGPARQPRLLPIVIIHILS